MKRFRLKGVLFASVLVLLYSSFAKADSINIGLPLDRTIVGSFYSGQSVLCCSQQLGLIFDAHQTFTIQSVGTTFGVDGFMDLTAEIYDTALVPFNELPTARGALLASSSGVVEDADELNVPNHPAGQHRYFDLPIAFTFEAGKRYEVVFPHFSFVSGTVIDPNNWAFLGLLYNHTDPSWADVPQGPFTVDPYLTVIDGSLRGSTYTGIPFARFDVVNSVPEPSTILLLSMGLAGLAVSSKARRRFHS